MRRIAAGGACAAGVALLAGCGSSSPPGNPSTASTLKPTRVIPGPADLVTGTSPEPNGTAWILAGTATARNIRELSIHAGTLAAAVPVSNSATSLAQSSTGLLAVGLGSGRTGAVELRDGTTGALLATVAVGAPVRDLAVGDDGTTLYALNGTPASASLTVINSTTHAATGTIPVPGDAEAVSPAPDQRSLYVLEPNGTVSEVDAASGKQVVAFSVGPDTRAMALSPDGSTLYVLKGFQLQNVALVDVNREAVTKVLPAPTGTVSLALGPDGTNLYDYVGTSRYGNIQVFTLAPAKT